MKGRGSNEDGRNEGCMRNGKPGTEPARKRVPAPLSAKPAQVRPTPDDQISVMPRESGHPDLAARAGALDSPVRGNDTTLKDLILNDARD